MIWILELNSADRNVTALLLFGPVQPSFLDSNGTYEAGTIHAIADKRLGQMADEFTKYLRPWKAKTRVY